MNIKTFALIALIPSLASANVVSVRFKDGTKLPQEMQNKVADALALHCEFPGSSNIFEIDTSARFVRVDQMWGDWHYTTVLQVAAMDDDGYHPREYAITVDSADYYPNGEGNLVVERVMGPGCR